MTIKKEEARAVKEIVDEYEENGVLDDRREYDVIDFLAANRDWSKDFAERVYEEVQRRCND